MTFRQSVFCLALLLAAGRMPVWGQAAMDPADIPQPPDREDAIEVTPARAVMYDAMVKVQDGFYEEAIPSLEWVIQQDPTLLGAWETLGWAYWLVDRRKDAEDLWNRLVAIAPNEPMGYNLLAQIATRNGDFLRAEELYSTSLRLNPDQYETRLNLARVLLWGGKTERAVALLRRLYEQDTDRIDVEIDLAWAMYVNEEYEDVIVRWDNIIDIIPENPVFLLARANVLLLLGSLREAEEDARLVLEVDPGNTSALNMLAALAVQTSRPEEAVEALRKVMDATADDKAKSQIALRIAVYMKSILDKDGAMFSRADIISATRESIDLYDRAVGAHLFLGEMLILDKSYAQAESTFRHVLDEFNPHNQRALFGLVETFFGRAMYDEVERQLRDNFRNFNSNNPFRHMFYARLHFARGNFKDALDSLDRLEFEGSQGSVFGLLYHGISPSEFSDMPSVRQLREQLMALRRDGFRFITPSDLPAYFEKKQPAVLSEHFSLAQRMGRAFRRALGSTEPGEAPGLQDYVPDKVVMVTFDDGLRNSFRYGLQVAEDVGVRMTMFSAVGYIVSRQQRYIASFLETRDFVDTGYWEVHSHLWDASELAQVDEDGRTALPLPNLLWLKDRNRRETLREYQARLRREFRDSRRVLIRELDLEPEDVFAVAYPIGEVGTETETNIRVFDVPSVILNEAEIAYKMGFTQYRNGYIMKTDDPMLYKRWEPDRQASGRQVLRQAYQQHPVFTARRMRAEMAALNGQLHMAQNNIALLKRDGYPEEDLAELQEYVRRHLARMVRLPEAVEDITTQDAGREPLISLRNPYIGVDYMLTRANEMIDDQEASVFAGLNITRRMALQVRAGDGRIKQTITTNNFVEVERTTVSSQQITEQTVEDGQVSNSQINRTTVSTVTVVSNQVDSTYYRADKTFVGLGFNYTHEDGSFTIGNARFYTIDGTEITNETAITYSLEHQWRPVPAIDLSAFYQHGLVPSAREVIMYDGLGLRPFWRIRDGWQANALAYFAFYEDRNSLVKTEVENFWRLSQPYDIWLGLHNSLETMDRDTDLYWSPFWEQRHYLILRLRRGFPGFYGMIKGHVGIQKSEARREEKDRYENARAQGEAQGWSPGTNPDGGWEKLLGFGCTLTRTFQSGFEVTGEFTVNTSGEYTEHALTLRLLYTFK